MRLLRTRETPSPLGHGRARLVGEIAFDTEPDRTEEAWFDVPGEFAGALSDNGNPWLAALLPLAGRLNEPLRLCLPVDPVMLGNASEVLDIWRCWYPFMHAVPLEAEALPAREGERPERAAAFFSGGVDSFYTAIHAGDELTPPPDELITLWGSDIPIDDAAAFERRRQSLGAAADAFGKGLVDAATNLRKLMFRRCRWDLVGHGAALAAVALLFEQQYTAAYIASSDGYRNLQPWGSHPLTDPLFSTRRLRIVHHGAELTRAEKLTRVAEHPVALNTLHVCWESQSDRNCGVCGKCYCTMLHLYLLGRLDRASTFSHAPFDVSRAGRVYATEWPARSYMRDMQALALAKGRTDIADDIERGLARATRRAKLLAGARWFGDKRLLWRLQAPLEFVVRWIYPT